jgi:hypothetical protein
MNKSNWSRTRERLRSSVEHRLGVEFQMSKIPALSGTVAFASPQATLPRFFLLFQRSDTQNAFFTELAWSVTGQWPAFPSLAADVAICRDMPEGRFRIEQFWLTPPIRMQAWCLTKPLGLRQLVPGHDARSDEESPDADIAIVVDQCCDRIRDVVLPLMKDIRSNLGGMRPENT